MNPSSWNDQPSGEPRHYERPTHRAATAPISGYPAHPRALMPGYVPQTLNRPDLFFTNASRMTIAHDVRHSHFSPPPPVPLSHPPYYYTTSQIHHPPPPVPPFPHSHVVPTHPGIQFRRSLTSPPPVPPKPPPPQSLFSSSAYHGNQGLPMESTPPDPSDENDLAMALALSQSVSSQEKKLRDKLNNQEEDDLARALEESLLFSEKPNHSVPIQDDVMEGPSSISLDAFPVSRSSGGYGDDDEALARMLAMEQEQEGESISKVAPAASESLDSTAELPIYVDDRAVNTPVTSNSQTLLSDEAFAQKLALEDGDYDQGPLRSMSPDIHSSGLPLHDERLSNPPYQNSTTEPTHHANHTLTSVSTPDLPAYAETIIPSSPNTSSLHLSRPGDPATLDPHQSSPE
ncbi:hypothetical protein BDZ94DRAFT_489739 [Collybia nuda]|uniref:Uncharacterized protein n=1 Tax=Collybia nuda TaxID=64659 RepID=A0A9P5Y6U4_9AGAR|nr:hypothetical protein BDZ94DRAFT_489739 [Collybia nuda]